MRRYETTIIVRPSVSQEERQAFFDKVTALISSSGALLIRFDEWGQRRLAYEIKKETRGYYAFLEYCGDGPLVKEVERNIRLDDRSLKYMTICTSQEVDAEAVKAEIEAAKAKEAEAETVTEDETPAPSAEAGATETPSEDTSSATSDSVETSEKEATPNDSI
jgi:small subunit ribosomal protein S6